MMGCPADLKARGRWVLDWTYDKGVQGLHQLIPAATLSGRCAIVLFCN